jgi:hypothetical protein
MSASRVRRTLGVAAAAVLLGCGVPADRSATVVPDDAVPYDLLSPTTTAPAQSAPAETDTTVCLELDGVLLALGRARGGPDGLRDDLALVTAGPTEGESLLGVRTALEGDEPVLAVERRGGRAEVELSEEVTELPADQQLLAVAQVTCTLTAQPGVTEVAFLLGERRLEVPVQGGELVDRPVRRADYAELLAN